VGPIVIVLHGGPAAAGSAAPLAQGLADSFRVLEPWQRGSGEEPLTVRIHISDLHDLIRMNCDKQRPAMVGESWGAMLALAYAAEHPGSVGPLALVGCGTFEEKSRMRMHSILNERMDENTRREIAAIEKKYPDPNVQLMKQYELTKQLYNYDPVGKEQNENSAASFDMQAHKETWNDMIKLQKNGVYPRAFSSITSPVLMLHGSYDPHPGQMIRDSLRLHLPQLHYVELDKCGHSPWIERAVQDEFFILLKNWLAQNLDNGTTGQ
jgi:pimeloyl-ACP methyl ester carboxylesterase